MKNQGWLAQACRELEPPYRSFVVMESTEDTVTVAPLGDRNEPLVVRPKSEFLLYHRDVEYVIDWPETEHRAASQSMVYPVPEVLIRQNPNYERTGGKLMRRVVERAASDWAEVTP